MRKLEPGYQWCDICGESWEQWRMTETVPYTKWECPVCRDKRVAFYYDEKTAQASDEREAAILKGLTSLEFVLKWMLYPGNDPKRFTFEDREVEMLVGMELIDLIRHDVKWLRKPIKEEDMP